MRTTVQRAHDMMMRGRWRMCWRFWRRIEKRAAKCLGIALDRVGSDDYDNSLEIYDCTRDYRLTQSQVDRLLGMGIGTVWLNSDRQQVTYSMWHKGKCFVDKTAMDARRRLYPDAVVIFKGKKMTHAEANALIASEQR